MSSTNLRRIGFLVAAVLLVFPALATSAHALEDDPLTAEERAWYEAHGPIRYAPDPDFPPFEFLDEEGEPVGINFDFLNRMSRNLDIQFDIRLYDNWTAVLDAMRAGEIDMVGSIASNAERSTYMDFVGPFMSYGEVFYTNDQHPGFDGPSDLVGHKVAVVENYAAASWLEEHHPELELVYVPNLLTGLERLSTGEVDAFFENVPVGGFYIREHSFNNIRIMGEPAYYSDANWAYTKGVEPLGGIITKGLDSIPPGEQTRIFEYWTGYDLGIPEPAVAGSATAISPLAGGIIMAIAAGLVLVVAWSATLRQQVRSRTADLRDKERELLEANRDLERRVAARTAELHELGDNMQILNATVGNAMQQTAATNEHFLNTLRNQYHGLIKGPAEATMGAAEVENGRLLRTAASLDLLAKALAPKREVAAVDVANALVAANREAVKMHVALPPAVQVPDGAAPVEAEPTLLQAALVGLIARVAQDLPPESEWSTRLEQAVRPNQVAHTLHFRSPRFKPEDVERIIEALRPERPTGGRPDLALVAAARVIHRSGGDLHAFAMDGGVSFSFTLPPAGLVAATTERPQSHRARST